MFGSTSSAEALRVAMEREEIYQAQVTARNLPRADQEEQNNLEPADESEDVIDVDDETEDDLQTPEGLAAFETKLRIKWENESKFKLFLSNEEKKILAKEAAALKRLQFKQVDTSQPLSDHRSSKKQKSIPFSKEKVPLGDSSMKQRTSNKKKLHTTKVLAGLSNMNLDDIETDPGESVFNSFNNFDLNENLNVFFSYEHLINSSNKTGVYFKISLVEKNNLIVGNIIPVFNSSRNNPIDFPDLQIVDAYQVTETDPVPTLQLLTGGELPSTGNITSPISKVYVVNLSGLKYFGREIISDEEIVHFIDFLPPKVTEKLTDSRTLWCPGSSKPSRSQESTKTFSKTYAIARILGENSSKLEEFFGATFDVSDSFVRESTLRKIPRHYRILPACNEIILPLLLAFNWVSSTPKTYPKVEGFHLRAMFPIEQINSVESLAANLTVRDIYDGLRDLTILLNSIFVETNLFNSFFKKFTDIFDHIDRVIYDLHPVAVLDVISDQLAKFALQLRQPSIYGISRNDLIHICTSQIDFSMEVLSRESFLYSSKLLITPSFTRSDYNVKNKGKKDGQGKGRPKAKASNQPSGPVICATYLACELKVITNKCKFPKCSFNHIVIPTPVTQVWKDATIASLSTTKQSPFLIKLHSAIQAL